MPGHDDQASGLRLRGHSGDLFRVAPDRLLHEHVLAGGKRLPSDVEVTVYVREDEHRIDARVGERRVERFVGAHAPVLAPLGRDGFVPVVEPNELESVR